MKTDISIIIPTIGTRPEYLLEAVKSCHRAASKHLIEILVIFNGMTEQNDRLLVALAQLNVKFFLIEQRGANYARNYGLTLANGEFCMFLDDDDWLNDGKLSMVIDKMRSERIDVCSCSVDVFEHDQVREVKRQPTSSDLISNVLTLSLVAWPLAHVHRTKRLTRKPWSESLDAAHDQIFFMELCRLPQLRWTGLPIALGTYRCHSGIKQSAIEGKLGNELGLYRLNGLMRLIDYLKNKRQMSADRYKAARDGVRICAHQLFVSHPLNSTIAMGRLCIAELKDRRLRAAPYWLIYLAYECSLYPFRLVRHSRVFRSR